MVKSKNKERITKKLESMKTDLEKAYSKSEYISRHLGIPSLGELLLIKVQVEQLIEMAKEK